jgi:PAS domain S-box-containing protein
MASTAHAPKQLQQAEDVHLLVDTIPTLAWSARADGSADFFNRRWLDYTGLSAEEASDWGWSVALQPEDRERVMHYWRRQVSSGEVTVLCLFAALTSVGSEPD